MNTVFRIFILCFFAGFFLNSCDSNNEFSLSNMQSKSIDASITMFSIDNVKVDTINQRIDANELGTLFSDIQDVDYYKAFYHNTISNSDNSLYTILLQYGNNKLLRLVSVDKNKISDVLEIAGVAEFEGFSIKISSEFINDTSFVVYKTIEIKTDEPLDESLGDSVVVHYVIDTKKKFKIEHSDTFKLKEINVKLSDDEFADELCYYNNTKSLEWVDAGISDSRAFKTFFMEFRNMVRLNDKDRIALYLKYPIGSIKNEKYFTKNYDKIFTPKVRNAILNQEIRRFYRDKRGVMVGENIVWFAELAGKYKIVTIN